MVRRAKFDLGFYPEPALGTPLPTTGAEGEGGGEGESVEPETSPLPLCGLAADDRAILLCPALYVEALRHRESPRAMLATAVRWMWGSRLLTARLAKLAADLVSHDRDAEVRRIGWDLIAAMLAVEDDLKDWRRPLLLGGMDALRRSLERDDEPDATRPAGAGTGAGGGGEAGPEEEEDPTQQPEPAAPAPEAGGAGGAETDSDAIEAALQQVDGVVAAVAAARNATGSNRTTIEGLIALLSLANQFPEVSRQLGRLRPPEECPFDRQGFGWVPRYLVKAERLVMHPERPAEPWELEAVAVAFNQFELREYGQVHEPIPTAVDSEPLRVFRAAGRPTVLTIEEMKIVDPASDVGPVIQWFVHNDDPRRPVRFRMWWVDDPAVGLELNNYVYPAGEVSVVVNAGQRRLVHTAVRADAGREIYSDGNEWAYRWAFV